MEAEAGECAKDDLGRIVLVCVEVLVFNSSNIILLIALYVFGDSDHWGISFGQFRKSLRNINSFFGELFILNSFKNCS